MILSAISLWKQLNVNPSLDASEWNVQEKNSAVYSEVTFNGHEAVDGRVRIYARFYRPSKVGKKPTILLLPDAGQPLSDELPEYFLSKGYAVLMPDYSGKISTDKEEDLRTIYPPSLAYGNYENARGLYEMAHLQANQTTWFEWLHLAVTCIEYLKQRSDVASIGVIGVRKGGDLAWQVMLSADIKCGVPINSVGWRSFSNVAKFGGNVMHDLSDDKHCYIAAVEAQSYAAYVKCPVLMLCSLRDTTFDCDRAYDTFSRIGNPEGNALVYSTRSGASIGPNALYDMDLFLEKNLKGREIYIPDSLNVSVIEDKNGIKIDVEWDEEGILDTMGIYYAEADVLTRCAYRDWQRIYQVAGNNVKGHSASCVIKPFEGATAVFIFAYAKYINGFRVMSKIVSKKLNNPNLEAVKGKSIFTGIESDTFSIAQYHEYAIGDIFLEREAMPKIVTGYGNIKGAYSVGGIKTYKISSPMYIPDENAMLEFDVYMPKSGSILVSIEVGDVEHEMEKYTSFVEVKGGGKWKRIILKAGDFKGELSGMPLKNFFDGKSLMFDGETDETEYAVTNILWL